MMKGIILHGGTGTRLRPLTYTDVKQLLPIAGKPISEYALENLIEIGITEVNIVIGSIGSEEVNTPFMSTVPIILVVLPVNRFLILRVPT